MANKFVSVLDSIGSKFKQGVKKAIALETYLAPAEQEIADVVGAFDPAAGATLDGLIAVVGNVEQIATAVGAASGTGEQKLAAALPAIEAAILSDPLFKGKTIPDEAAFNTAIEDFTSALVDICNAFKSSSSASTTTATAAAPAAPVTAAVAPATAAIPLTVKA